MFLPPALLHTLRSNISRFAWARDLRDDAVRQALPWSSRSDEELWSLMFGPTITRAWHVWSNGHCPACRAGVAMYNWKIDAIARPWKVECPHCGELFPKNDFEKFYRSGLDEGGVFDPGRADRSLLFSAEHPDPADPRHRFGVDDGEGCVEGEHRWRFIGGYLIYGQWKALVLGGITRLAAAYVLTGEKSFAHRAGVMLARVADLYGSFDHKTQAWVYETVRTEGFVSTWHDACEETRELILAYDLVRGALAGDEELARFLEEKKSKGATDSEGRRPESSVPPDPALDSHGRLPPAASAVRGTLRDTLSPAAVCAHIEDGIAVTALRDRHKIQSNYPRREITLLTALAVLDRPGDRAEFDATLDAVLEMATAVDGVTGEKGLAGYTAFTIQGIASFLMQLEHRAPGTLKDLIRRHPRLAKTWRFHLDTWCLQTYYPQIGDSGFFAGKSDRYVGVAAQTVPAPPANLSLAPSMDGFLWTLQEITGDPAFAQVIHHLHANEPENIGRHLFEGDPEGFAKKIGAVVARHGTEIAVGSIDLKEWHLALLRSGAGKDARVAWLDYDTGGSHSHADGMNLGLFAKGLDLMPDFGYPPVHLGGWTSPHALWYTRTAAHNTVVIDGTDQPRRWDRTTGGKTTLWSIGETARVVRVSGADVAFAPETPEPKRYERTVATIDISPANFYLVDIFRVVGGRDHAKFQHSHFGAVTTHGLNLLSSPAGGEHAKPRMSMRGSGPDEISPSAEKPITLDGLVAQNLMRDFRTDPRPSTPWRVDWRIEDRHRYLPPGTRVGLSYTDLTAGAAASLCAGWVTMGLYDVMLEEAWIPRVMVRRTKEAGEAGNPGEAAPLASCFVSVVEPHDGESRIKSVRRLTLHDARGAELGDKDVALEVELVDGRRDLIVALDAERAASPGGSREGGVVQKEWGVNCADDFLHLRRAAVV